MTAGRDGAVAGGRTFRAELAWLVAGQAGIALGGLLAVRILTGLLAPADYGALTLLLGVGALVLSLFVNPVVQAGMRFLPDARAARREGLMRRIARSWLGAILSAAGLALAAGGLVLSGATGAPAFVGVLLGVLLALDAWRVHETALLNAARRQRPMVLWRTTEALARPLLALAAILALGAGAWQALLGYAAATAATNLLFHRTVPARAGGGPPGAGADADEGADEGAARGELAGRMRRYALPLTPVGALGWVNGTGDRYVVAALVGLDATGLFAAVYAVTSRPFIALQGLLDALFRPRLYDAATRSDGAATRRALLAWLAAAGIFGGAGVVLFALLHALVADLLLGPGFREASWLMPLIALGYLVLGLQAPLGRLLHARYRTDRVLMVSAVTAAASLFATAAGVALYGIAGAAAAVPLYFAVQLAATVLLVRARARGDRGEHPAARSRGAAA